MNRLVPALLALSGFVLQTGCTQPAPEPSPSPVAEVTSVRAAVGEMAAIATGFGTIRFAPTGRRTLTAEVEARVTAIEVQPGESVEPGATVLRLTLSSTAEVDLERARRDAASAESAAARTRRLRRDGLAHDGDVEAADQIARDRRALADSLEARAGTTLVVTSPIAGLVDALLVGEGDLVPAATPLARIASLDAIEAGIGVEIEDLQDLHVGCVARLEALDRAGTVVEGRIARIDHRVDPETRMAIVYVPLPRSSRLVPGEAVRARIVTHVDPAAVLVPRRAVLVDEAGPYVFVEADGLAELRRVRVGRTAEEQTAIERGIEVGENVIVEGAAVLTQGMAVRPAGPRAAGT